MDRIIISIYCSAVAYVRRETQRGRLGVFSSSHPQHEIHNVDIFNLSVSSLWAAFNQILKPSQGQLYSHSPITESLCMWLVSVLFSIFTEHKHRKKIKPSLHQTFFHTELVCLTENSNKCRINDTLALRGAYL